MGNRDTGFPSGTKFLIFKSLKIKNFRHGPCYARLDKRQLYSEHSDL